MLDLYVDIATCPVYPEVVRSARVNALELYVVTRDYFSADANVHLILAQDDGLSGREWIGANIRRGDICVTDDTMLASSCLERGAAALSLSGLSWTPDALVAATRNPAGSKNRKADAGSFSQRLEATIAAQRSADNGWALKSASSDRLPSRHAAVLPG